MEYVKFSKFIISTQYGYTAKETSLVEGDAKYLRITDIVPYFVNKEQVPFCKIDDNKKKKYLISENDLLIARTGATTGYNLVVDESYKNFVFASYLIRFNYNKNILYPLYLKYVLKSQQWYGFVNNFISGSAQPGMNAKVFGKFQIPFLNYDIQKRISNILSTYDNLIENNNKRIKLLEQMAENLYKEWFVRFRFPGYEDVEFENGIPKDWEISRANQLFDITIGKTPDRKIFEYFSNIPECNYPWISISDMRSASTFVFKTKEYLTFNAVNTCNVKIIPKNTVILSFKLTVGQVAITTSDMCTNEAIAHFTTDNAAMREYIYLYLKKFQYSDLGNTSSIGTAVNSKIIKNMKIILPSSEVLKQFHDSTYSIFEEIRLLNENNNNLTKQRDLLLPRLMSGKLKV